MLDSYYTNIPVMESSAVIEDIAGTDTGRENGSSSCVPSPSSCFRGDDDDDDAALVGFLQTLTETSADKEQASQDFSV